MQALQHPGDAKMHALTHLGTQTGDEGMPDERMGKAKLIAGLYQNPMGEPGCDRFTHRCPAVLIKPVQLLPGKGIPETGGQSKSVLLSR